MQGVNHKRIGAGVAIVAGHASGLPLAMIPPVALIAYAASFEKSGPDIDQSLPFIKHRTVTHWAITCLFFAALAYVITFMYIAPFAVLIPFVGDVVREHLPLVVFLGLTIGWLAHLLADAMTIQGIPFFGPIYRKDVHLLPRGLRVRVGSMYKDSRSENVVMFLLAVACGVYFAFAYGIL